MRRSLALLVVVMAGCKKAPPPQFSEADLARNRAALEKNLADKPSCARPVLHAGTATPVDLSKRFKLPSECDDLKKAIDAEAAKGPMAELPFGVLDAPKASECLASVTTFVRNAVSADAVCASPYSEPEAGAQFKPQFIAYIIALQARTLAKTSATDGLALAMDGVRFFQDGTRGGTLMQAMLSVAARKLVIDRAALPIAEAKTSFYDAAAAITDVEALLASEPMLHDVLVAEANWIGAERGLKHLVGKEREGWCRSSRRVDREPQGVGHGMLTRSDTQRVPQRAGAPVGRAADKGQRPARSRGRIAAVRRALGRADRAPRGAALRARGKDARLPEGSDGPTVGLDPGACGAGRFAACGQDAERVHAARAGVDGPPGRRMADHVSVADVARHAQRREDEPRASSPMTESDRVTPERNFASSAGVGLSNIVVSGISTPRTSSMRETTIMARRECPPMSKKLSSCATVATSTTSANSAAMVDATSPGFSCGTSLARGIAGAGSCLRSTFPFSVIGRVSSSTKAEGTM